MCSFVTRLTRLKGCTQQIVVASSGERQRREVADRGGGAPRQLKNATIRESVTFQGIAGHRRVLDLLARAIANDTLTPSLILSGPEGVGKRLIAIAIAQALNRADARSASRIARGTHPDVHVIEPGESGSIKVEQVRAAIERAVYRPFEGRRRVTIIDGADALVDAAQNALLKTLEEPLPASVFILVTSRPDVLLPTVRSRCAHLRFGRLQTSDVADVLEQRHDYSRTDALAAAATSDGSIRRALDRDAGEFVDARGDAESLLRVAGRDPRTRLEQAKSLLAVKSSAASEREHLGARLQALGSLLRDIGVLASGADDRLLANADRRQALEGFAKSFGGDRVPRAYAAVTRAQDALASNVGPKVVADWIALNV